MEKGEASPGITFDKAMDRAVLWRLDTRILPILALLFLCSFFDRTNVGNARLYGLEKEIRVTDLQYDIGLSVYYATYIFSEIPSNLILKKVKPGVWLPCLAFFWGITAMSTGFVKNFAQFTVVRAILGLCEGGLLPGMILYLSSIYNRSELAIRIGIFYTSASLSGAFSGLIARGIAQLDGRGGLSSWRWIFILFGLFSASVGFISFWLLPNGIRTAKFLTPEQREYAIRRLQKPAKEEHFSWTEVGRGVFSVQTWLTALAYLGILSGLYSFGLFLPTIIEGLGYSADAAQLWSVIPYAVASFFTLCTAYLSDRLKVRGIIMLFSLPIAITGYAVIATTHNNSVKYGMTFLMATGLYASVPPVLGWLSNNSAGHYKRATTSALQLAIANVGGFVAVFSYPATDGPQYRQGHTIILSLLSVGWVLIFCNVLWCWKINKDKANGKYDQYIGYGDDREPSFKLVL
ncbi:MFS general substrate transporter [Xylariaceae sp. FL0255]|nr:MFS general substrate transporter [Xylariaceae sp. FL0255]